ncbi:MAG: hypothetical protein LBJ39_01425 [Tannerellaceae bacterium]|jgi:hypothetical protein|nr:hypothetical protein [Tannerellaceae bacterium]
MRILLITLVATLYIMPLHGQRGDWYNDEGGYSFEGKGTVERPYLISSVEGLVFLAEQVNIWPGVSFQGEYFMMTEDIDLGEHYWIPVGNEAHQPFRGVFNGNGKTIRNLYIGSGDGNNVYTAAGFFGHLGNGARVENLTISGGIIFGGGRDDVSRTGCIAGYLLCSVSDENDSIIVRNCHVGEMHLTGADTEVANTGGLTGECYSFSGGGGEALILIENCSYSGTVSAQPSNLPYTGGIAGKGRGHGYGAGAGASAGMLVFRSCLNRGNITGGDTRGAEATSSTGGILGFGYGSGDGSVGSSGSGSVTIEYCMNAGTITGGDAGDAQAFSYAGGLAGYGDGSGYDSGDSKDGTSGNSYGYGMFAIRSSANRGGVTGGDASDTTAVASTGGLLGFGSSSASGGDGKDDAYGVFSVRDCYSYAPVMAKSGFAGGLAGWIATIGKGSVSSIVRDSYAAGSIMSDTFSKVVAGGIAGRMYKSEDAVRGPQIGNCLAALSYLNGDAGMTFRIAGQVEGVRRPFNGILGRNYAFVRDGEWSEASTLKNGRDWSRMMRGMPVSSWNRSDVWVIRNDGRGLMPVLANIPWQENVPVP